jgi:hypothetical protein
VAVNHIEADSDYQSLVYLLLAQATTLSNSLLFFFDSLIVINYMAFQVIPSAYLVLFVSGIVFLPSVLVLLQTRTPIHLPWMILHSLSTPFLYGLLPLAALWNSDDICVKYYNKNPSRAVSSTPGRAYSSTGGSSHASINPMRFTDYEQERKRLEKHIPPS